MSYQDEPDRIEEKQDVEEKALRRFLGLTRVELFAIFTLLFVLAVAIMGLVTRRQALRVELAEPPTTEQR